MEFRSVQIRLDVFLTDGLGTYKEGESDLRKRIVEFKC